MTVEARDPATHRAPFDRPTALALGPLALDLADLGGRARSLVDRIRGTGEEVVVLSRGRPVALISPFGADGSEPEGSMPWVEAIGR